MRISWQEKEKKKTVSVACDKNFLPLNKFGGKKTPTNPQINKKEIIALGRKQKETVSLREER